MPRVQTGLARLCSDERHRVAGRRIGLLAHPASVTDSLESAHAALVRAGALVRVLFGPEHGVGGEAQDMEGVPQGASGHQAPVPAWSLYGDSFASLSPQEAWLDGLDAVVIDLQDVGARYYTFVWTALLMARVCQRVGVEVLVCDRPNPLGGITVEGAPQVPSQCSFVGLVPTPVRHGLTAGEIARWTAGREGLSAVTVIPMAGWHRAMTWEDTGLPWVPPSPNMPTADTARVYPGGCLLEGTNLSEGRGTTRPFEFLGAPWLDPDALAAAVARHAGPGCTPRVMSFRPGFQKHAGRTCVGIHLHVTDAGAFRPYQAYLAVIRSARAMTGFQWRTEPYEFVSDRPAIDLLTGDPAVRRSLDAGDSVEACLAHGQARLEAWEATAPERWLYPAP